MAIKKIVLEVQWLPPDRNDNRSESSRNPTDRASSPSKSACSYRKRSIRIGSPSRERRTSMWRRH
jgi:hypothetical protein